MGSKCELARLLGFESVGIDLVPGYVRLASEIFPECKFEVANALEFDYSLFDVVYYHVPFFEERLLIELESRIERQVAPGAHLVVTRSPSNVGDDSLAAGGSRWIPVECRNDVGRLIVLKKSS